MVRWLVAGLVALALPLPHAEARGGFLPPLEIELGGVVIEAPDGDRVTATQLLVGISWASLYPRPTPIDVSLGMIVTVPSAPERATAVAARRVEAEPPPGTSATGGFVALDLRVDAGRHWRAWVGGRGELMASDGARVLGAAARVSAELWAPVLVGSFGAGLAGTFAVIGWAELGVRERPDGGVANLVAAGVGIRLPLLIAR